MPQITLKISHNIDKTQIDFHALFAEVHALLHEVGKITIANCSSGVIQEDFSYIGLGENKLTKLYLEVYWLEDEQRLLIKSQVGEQLIRLLKDKIVPILEEQKLSCIPRVRIADLGQIGRDYFIGKSS